MCWPWCCCTTSTLVEQAVTEALKIEQPSKQHVLNCLSRISEQPRPKPTAATTGAEAGH